MSQGFRNSKGDSVTGFNVYTEDGYNFILLEDYVYERKDGCIIPMTKGGTSDGLSYPQATWNITPPFGEGWKEGYLHDIGYRNGLPKDFMDETLLEAMEFYKVPEWRAKITYEGVHLGGQSSYDEDVAEWRKKNGF